MKIKVKISTGKAIGTDDYSSLYNKPMINGVVLSGDVSSADLDLKKSDVGLNNVDNTSDEDKPISNATQAALNDKVSYSELNSELFNGMKISRSSDNFVAVFDTINFSNQSRGETSVNIPLANDSNSGLMSPSDYRQIRALISRVENLESKTTRLLYTANTNPTAEQINEFVTSLGYVSPFEGIAVVVDETFHIWHYYDNDNIGWKDDGLDTVSNFTNSSAGVITGSNEDGKVYAETDGTGSVKGWSELKTRVSNLETNKLNTSDVQNEVGESEDKPISQKAASLAIAQVLSKEQTDIASLDAKIPVITTTLKANGAYTLTIKTGASS